MLVMSLVFFMVSTFVEVRCGDGQAFIQDRAFHVPLERKLFIASLIRVFLQPSGSYIPSQRFQTPLMRKLFIISHTRLEDTTAGSFPASF